MLLAIDVGNTNTVFALFQGDVLAQSWRCQTVATRCGDEYASFLNEMFRLANIAWDDISDVIVGSVVPEANFHLQNFCQSYIKSSPVLVNERIAGIHIDLDQPAEAGADRLVNAAAVISHYQLPAIVIDFGTATTFDVVDARGHYRGGAIAPGVNLSVAALHQAAAKLPIVSIAKPERAIGTSTTTAMQSGLYWGYIGLIEGLIGQITQELETKAFVIATGGLASLYSQGTALIDAVDEELTLKGLLQIHQMHSKKQEAA